MGLLVGERIRRRPADIPAVPAYLPLAEARFVVFDTETTGFFPGRGDEVIALGAVACRGGDPLPGQTFHRLVKPGRQVPPVVRNLTGLTDERLAAEGVPFLEAIDRFLDFAGEAILVGHGVDFDLAFLNHQLRRARRRRLRHFTLDTRRLHQALFPELEDYSLDTLLRLHGIPLVGRHTALGDAMLTAELWRLALPALADRGCLTVRSLRRFAVFHPHLPVASVGCLV